MQGSVLSLRAFHVLTVGLLSLTGGLRDLSPNPAKLEFHLRLQALVALGALPNLRVGPTNFEKIRRGMSEEEVQKVLGRPTKVEDLSRYSVTKVVPAEVGYRHFRVSKTATWVGLERVILVTYGEKGTAEWSEIELLETWAELNGIDARSLVGRLWYWMVERIPWPADE